MTANPAPLLAEEAKAQGATRAQALYNVLCFTVGAGMLGLPRALLFSRELFLLPIASAGILCLHTAQLLFEAQQRLGAESYLDLAWRCGGRDWQRALAATLTLNQAGIAVLFTITVCRNTELELSGSEDSPRWWLYVLLAGVTFVTSSIGESFAHVSVISTVGMASVLAVGVIVAAAAWREERAAVDCPSVSLPEALAGLGSVIFAFGGHPVFPDVQGSMAAPQDFGRVLVVGSLLMTALFAAVLQSSWDAFGCSVQGYLLDSLSPSPWRSAAVVGMTLHLLAAIPIVLLPVMRMVEGSFPAVNYRIVRLAIVLSTTLVARACPFFSDVVSLMGGVTENVLVFWFPIIFHYLTFGRARGVRGYLMGALHLAILALAAAILVLGAGSSLQSMAEKWRYRIR